MPKKKNRKKIVRTFAFKIDKKAMEETTDENGIRVGIIKGYGAVFGNLDHHRDIIEHGAFAKTLKERPSVVMLADHMTTRPIGKSVVAKEDTNGLYCEFHVNLETRDGQEKYSLAKQGAVDGLSIGFQIFEDEYDRENDIRRIKEIKLWEVSIVTFPANEQARITDVLSDDDDVLAEVHMEGLKSLVAEASAQLADALETQSYKRFDSAMQRAKSKFDALAEYASKKAESNEGGDGDTAPIGKDHAAADEEITEEQLAEFKELFMDAEEFLQSPTE